MWLEKRRDPKTEFWDTSKCRCQGNEAVARNVREKHKWVWFPKNQMKKILKGGVRDQRKAINIEYLDFSKACGKVSKKISSTRKKHINWMEKVN